MNNDTFDNNQNNVDVYADNPGQGQERNRVTQDTQNNTAPEIIPNNQQAGSLRDRTLQQTANQNDTAPVSSGQQSSTSSDSSSAGGFGQPESGFGQQAQGGSVQPQSGYNQSDYNQPGTYSQEQGGQQRMDGMRDTEGSNYDQKQGDTNLAEQPANANRSGAQPAVNTPGTAVDTPGRDTGSAWGQDEQMGQGTDRSERRNPAG